MNKNISNLKFEIGNLFLGKNGANYNSSTIKNDGMTEFSSCLTKVSEREDKPSLQNEVSVDSASKSEKKTDDFNEINNEDTTSVKETGKNTETENNDVVKAENSDKADETVKVEGDIDDTTENAEEMCAAVAGTIAGAVVQTDIAEVVVVDTEIQAIEGVDGSALNLSSVNIGDMNKNADNTGNMTNTDVFTNVISGMEDAVIENIDTSDVAMQMTNESVVDTAHGVQNIINNEVIENTENVLTIKATDNMNAFANQVNMNTNVAENSENVAIDDAIAGDIVSVNVTQEVVVENNTNVNSAIEMTEVQSVSADDVKIKTDNEIENENIGEVNLELTEKTGEVVKTDASMQNNEENAESDNDSFGEMIDAEVETADRTEFEPRMDMPSRIDVRTTVNLQNAATRNANAAQAVQNTILQNTVEMTGRMESKSMELMLNPASLGKIVIRMQSTADGLNIKIIADNMDINRGLELRMFQIETTLKAQGVNLNNIEIEHGSVSDSTTSGFTGFENSAHDYEGFAEQNQNSNRSNREEYIEYTEYTYGDAEGADLNSADSIWRTGGSNVEFLA